MTLLALFGGLALVLYGMQLTGEGLQRAAGGHLRHFLTSMTRTPLAAVGSGAAVTALIQSSSATTLMLIGFVSAGLLSFRQSLGVILGADIGTTLTVQLLAFRIQEASLLLVGIGFAVSFFARRGLAKSLGQAVLGFGFLFLGMKVMTDGLAPLAQDPLTRQVVVALAGNPFLGLLVGAVGSASMASSAATIGLVLSLSAHGLLPLSGAIPVVLGANVGTCATALAASLRSSAEARRVAFAHIAFKVLGAALVLLALLVTPFGTLIPQLVADTASDPARQIANFHTLFNILISALFLPFAGVAARTITALVPEDQQADNPFKTRYLDDRYLDQPSLALGQALREALRMGDVAQGMLRDAMVVLRTDNQELLEDVERRDDQLDYLEREIKLFISRLGRETMSPDMAQREIGLISFIGNLENIGDIIDKNLMELARKKLYQGRRFSEAGEAELIEFHGMIAKNLERAIAGFAAADRTLAQEVLDQRPVVRQRERELRGSHLARLRRGLAESLETSEIHLDVLTNLKRISSHITALVFPILEEV
jgi:phosphate:Na+ symporter